MNNFYYTYSSFLKNLFKSKVYKIPININGTCPNRDGTKGIGGCIYCSETGSGINSKDTAKNQVKKFLEKRKKKKEKYIPYFQAFSNMYGESSYLLEQYRSVLIDNNIVGIAIATRPDTINRKILSGLRKISKNYFVQIELGLESANNRTLKKINRQDKAETFITAVSLIKQYIENVHIVGHIIIGLFDEDYNDFLKSIEMIYKSGAHGIKFHNLYIEKSMKIYEMYKQNKINLIKENEYINVILNLLEELPENIVIHRLKSISNNKILIAPRWTNDNEFYNKLGNMAKEKKSYQGKKYGNNHFNCW